MIIEDMTTVRNFKHLLDYSTEQHADVNFVEYKENGEVKCKKYSDLRRDCDALSRFIVSNGLKGAHIAIVGSASYEWVTAFLGTVDTGSVAVPLAPAETDEMNIKLAEFADCTAFIFDKAHSPLYKLMKETIGEMKTFISLDNTSEDDGVINIADIFNEYAGEYTDEPESEDLCAIMFTSGTTGFPKGVMLTHKNFIYTGTSVHNAYPTQRMLGCLPFHHAFGLTGNITKQLVNGRTLCMNDKIANIYSDLQLYKPNGMLAVPQIIKFLFAGAFKYAEKMKDKMNVNDAVHEFFGGAMVDICSGAAPLEAEINNRFNATGINVFNGYGMTECAPIVANNVEGHYCPGSVGRLIPCLEGRISDIGEIQLKGPNVMKGYYKNPEATKEAFTEDGWLRTGDLGRFNEEGFLFITGRCKNLILLDNGENVSAEFIEEKLATEPLIKECICFGNNGAIYAEIYPDKDYAASNNITDIEAEMPAVLARANKSLTTFQAIQGFILRTTPLERTTSGKIKRNVKHGEIKKEIVAPETETEKKVASAVCELLELKEVSMKDNFFTVGGNSLNAVELSVSLNIKTQLIYDNPILSQLSAAIEKENAQLDDRIKNINDIIAQTEEADDTGNYKCALLTGATGFLGVHILKELISSGIKVYSIVRSPEKLIKQTEYYFSSLDMSNVIPVKGNIEDENLGLSEEEYDRLTKEVDVVFHVAANVHHAGDYSDLERTNVGGTRNIINFCKKADAVLQHTSTVSVHGSATVIEKTEKATFDEHILDIGQHYADNVYIHSKYCAEQLVLLARQEGLKANIYRIGNLTWRRSDGVFQTNSEDNGFLHRIHAILKLGIYHENMGKYPTDLTAVDECADAYVRLALSGRTNKIWHMFNPNFLDERDLFERLGRRYRTVSTAEAIELCMANLDDRDIHVYMFYMIISGRSSQVEMVCRDTCDALSQLDFKWGHPDRDYLTVSKGDRKPYCLDFEENELHPMRNSGGKITPIGKLTLGVLKEAKPRQAKIIRGAGTVLDIKEECEALGVKNPLFITVPFKMESIEKLLSLYENRPCVFSEIAAEPTVSDSDKALSLYLENGCDGVVAIGGGSVLDIGKITALRAANPDSYIEDICKLDSEAEESVPLFVAPTTAGTGSEATLFAVATQEDENKKRPFTSDKFAPSVIVLDPVLTVSVPRMSTAFTGIDALSHAVESYISLFAPSFPEDAEMAPKAAKLVFENLEKACSQPENLEVRAAMQEAAYLAGVSFGRISTGYIHAIAHRFGEFYHVPHGLAIAAAFTAVLRAYMPFGEKKLAQLSKYCGFGDENDSDEKNAYAFIEKVDSLIEKLGIDISSIAFNESDVHEIALKAQEEAKLVGYPRAFSDVQVGEIVRTIINK